MRYGILSDIHANLEALSTVLDFLRSQKVERYLCTGDIVGYGPNPNECVALVRTLVPLRIVIGNHDRAACGLKDITSFNPYAAKAILWTRKVLTLDHQIYLSELPKVNHTHDITLVHGSPRDPLDEYLLTELQFRENIPFLKTPVTFVGHSHSPLICDRSGLRLLSKDRERILLSSDEKYIINAGSVGQPRDGNPKASCAVYDADKREFRLFRIEYDIAETQRKMFQARLPAFLTERLSWGK